MKKKGGFPVSTVVHYQVLARASVTPHWNTPNSRLNTAVAIERGMTAYLDIEGG